VRHYAPLGLLKGVAYIYIYIYMYIYIYFLHIYSYVYALPGHRNVCCVEGISWLLLYHLFRLSP
jgi:uncharacterized membrane protein